MKQWQETSQILDRLTELAEAGRSAALATVVHIEGSSYRRPGAKLLIEESGAMLGGVSGGCLEADVRLTALAVLDDGRPRIRHYDTSTDEDALWGLGLGCNGAIDVFVQPICSPDAVRTMASVRKLLGGDAPFAVSTVIRGRADPGRVLISLSGGELLGERGDADFDRTLGDRVVAHIATRTTKLERVSDADVFTEVMEPPPLLAVFGAGDDARPLVALASAVGFRVCVVDHRPAYLTPERFPLAARLVDARGEDETAEVPLPRDTYAVVMTHSLAHDQAWVNRLLRTAVPYVGLLGPRARTREILSEVEDEERARVFGPVGIDVGADGPEQVALSVVAEVLAVRSGSTLGHLRDRSGVIHAC